MKSLIKLIGTRLFVVAVLLRVIIMPFFFHPDLREHHFHASFLKSGVFNIYTYISNHKQDLTIKQDFSYFPLTYFSLGIYQLLISPILGSNFSHWLTMGYSNNEIFRYLFFLKLPYLILDILVALFIADFFQNTEKKRKAVLFWLFNPFSLVLIYFYSNIDIIPVFFSVLSLYFVRKNKGFFAGVMLAIGTGFKAYPILLLPALLLTKEKFSRQIINLFTSTLVFVAIILPFWSSSFLTSSFSSGLTNRIFENGIDVGLIRKIPYFLILYIVGFIYIYFKKRRKQWLFYLLTTLLLVATIDYHIQWLLWFAPFLVVLIVNNIKYLIYVLLMMLIGITIPLLLNDRYLSVALLSPISRVFLQVSYPYLFIRQFIDPMSIQKILRYAFFIVSTLVTYKVIIDEK